MTRIIALEADDVRFPTSREHIGSDAMNPDPDYSAVYVRLRTDDASASFGCSLIFTIGRGNDVQTEAVRALAPVVVGRRVADIVGDLGEFGRSLTSDSQLRWLGPEKGVIHMAVGGVINAAWDLAARLANQPLWRFIAQMSPDQLVDVIDFRYLSDALTRSEALDILERAHPTRAARTEKLLAQGYPAYTTSVGWIGYPDDKLEGLVREAVDEGYRTIKLKVGESVEDDVRRLSVVRRVAGDSVAVAVDANQRWDVPVAIDWINELKQFDLAWVEEPTSPDDILGHATIRRAVAPVPVSTGEHVHNRVMFKQLLQAGSVDLMQIDAARVGGVNENLAILLMAAKFGVRVFPHAGGVGLCEMVQHLAMADFIAISGSMDDRAIEYVTHLHEHFVDPVHMRRGCYLAPSLPGMSAQMKADSVRRFAFPSGAAWNGSNNRSVA